MKHWPLIVYALNGAVLCAFECVCMGVPGCPTDMSLMKGMLGMLYPHIDTVCSRANEVGIGETLVIIV